MRVILLLLAFYTAPPTNANSHVPTCEHTYRVQSGDYLSKISSNWQYTAQLNHIVDPNLIYPHDVICLDVPEIVPHQQGTTSTPSTVQSHTLSSTHPNLGVPGGCVWYVFNQRPDFYIPPTPYAMQFGWVAQQNGYRVGYTPAVNAIVVFQAGVQGASNMGHVAIVKAVYANGSFLIEEMNGPRGAWATDYRVVWQSSGESFIY